MSGFPLEPIEQASRAELRSLQLERLQRSLAHAYERVPHYRRKFDAAGVRPVDCRSLAELARFPFTTKADLRETYPFGLFAVPMDRIVRIHASSGTTGKPTVVGYTAHDIDTWTSRRAKDRECREAGSSCGARPPLGRPSGPGRGTSRSSRAARRRRSSPARGGWRRGRTTCKS